MRQKLSGTNSWRGRITATWIWVAPPLAMVGVVVAGSGGPSNLFIVDSAALAGANRQDSVFDDLAKDVGPSPGANGRLGSEKPSDVEIPITGTVDGQADVGTALPGSVAGIPSSVLPAYQRVAQEIAAAQPNCGLTWPLLAGIGKVESAHASGGRVDQTGTTRGEILGPLLDGGPGIAAIKDTDQGKFDGNTQWDRAVGPMQFIPGTWAMFGADGNADGVKNPHNIYDAARAAGEYLCSGGANLKDPRGLVAAVLRYNHSMDYVSTVLRWMQTYSSAGVQVPDRDGVVPPPSVDQDGNVEHDETPPVVDDNDPVNRAAVTQTVATPTPQPSATATTTAPVIPPTTAPTTPHPSVTPSPPATTTTPTTVPSPQPTLPTISLPRPSRPTSSTPTKDPSTNPTEEPSTPTTDPTRTPTTPDPSTPTTTPSTPTTTTPPPDTTTPPPVTPPSATTPPPVTTPPATTTETPPATTSETPPATTNGTTPATTTATTTGTTTGTPPATTTDSTPTATTAEACEKTVPAPVSQLSPPPPVTPTIAPTVPPSCAPDATGTGDANGAGAAEAPSGDAGKPGS
ncbi:lytic transglycosylase domain-containing protein [Kribbella deserti]|uniref:Lytic transglycosylase domain-containing protein n=1 Tax=Kribbella deserti TaxID=1926257 RepID=A0ABV6QUT7_9ACTN